MRHVRHFFKLKFFVCVGLSEEFSDIDFYTSEVNFFKLCSMLKCFDENATVMKKPHACVSLSLDSLNVDVTNFIGGVQKTYTLAAILDEHPAYWSALRVLIEWARTVRLVKSCGSEGIMTVISFCHLFVYFATASPLKSHSDEKPYTLMRLGNWMEAVRDSSCGALIYEFITFLSCNTNREWLLATVDPLTEDPLIKSDLIDDLRTNAEHAVMLLAVHDGDVRKLFQFCTKRRLLRLDRRYLDPKNASEERKELCLREIKANCNSTKGRQLLFELLERNGLFYVEVIGDYMPDIEKGINRIHNKVINARSRAGTLRYNTYHVTNSTIFIPELGDGPSTELSFSTYNGDQYSARHTGYWKSRLTIRNGHANSDWRTTEFQRYEIQFLKQMHLFQEKRQHMNVRKTNIQRFFSDMLCNVRCGTHYFFNVPETLHNSFETVSVQSVEEKVSHLEEALNLERQGNIVNDVDDSLTLIKSYDRIDDKKPLLLMPLHEMKKRFTESKSKNKEIISTLTDNKANGIRHSFYPNWSLGMENVKKFAARHGFKEVLPNADDFYATISVFWRQRELVIKCDRNGMIMEIRHRSTRWLSASFHKSENDGVGGGDVRTYLECRAVLDDDESCIETIVEYMQGRSIYTESFARQIRKCFKCNDKDDPDASFSPRPLIPDIFQLNWQFRSMRLVTPLLKFVNSDDDILWLHNIYDGMFHFQKSEFEWFPDHFEFEIHLCMEKLSDRALCKKSYDYSVNLFDFLKASS